VAEGKKRTKITKSCLGDDILEAVSTQGVCVDCGAPLEGTSCDLCGDNVVDGSDQRVASRSACIIVSVDEQDLSRGYSTHLN